MSATAFEPTRARLPSGVTFLHQHVPASATVTVSLSVPAGSAVDPSGKEGLASLVARGLRRGTSNRTKEEIGEVLDFRGAHLSGTAGRHGAGLVGKARAEDFEAIAELVLECARMPSFPDVEVDKLRGDRLTALREDEDDPAVVVSKELREMVYPEGHPYARRHKGTRESIAELTPEDLRRLHRDHYRPGAALVVVVGGVESARAREAIGRFSREWEGGPEEGGYREARVRIPDARPPEQVRERRVPIPDKQQADIALGHPGIRRDDERYHAAALMNTVLGRFAMGGRLGRSVREEQGMAYYTYSSLDASVGPGLFLVRAGVAPQHVEPAVESIVAEIERIRRDPIEESELEDAKAATIRSLPRALESNEGMAGMLHLMELYGLGLDYLDRFPDLVEAVTVEDVRRAAAEILAPERYGLAVAGPIS